MPDLTSTTDRPVRMVFTNRAGGASSCPYDSFNLGSHVGDNPSHVRENRHRLAASVGLDPEQIVWMEQLHTNTVTAVTGQHPEPVPATDALVTATRGLALAVLVADCVPVLLADHVHGVVAAAHAGRAGARNGIIRLTVEKMLDMGARPDNIQVLLGPAASGQRYEVPDEMATDVEKHLPGSHTRTLDGTPGIDVRAGLTRQLLDMRIPNIQVDPRCTIADDTFFSYRREGTTGRQAGLVWLP